MNRFLFLRMLYIGVNFHQCSYFALLKYENRNIQFFSLSFNIIIQQNICKHDVSIVDLPLTKRRNNWYLESLRNTSKNNICKTHTHASNYTKITKKYKFYWKIFKLHFFKYWTWNLSYYNFCIYLKKFAKKDNSIKQSKWCTCWNIQNMKCVQTFLAPFFYFWKYRRKLF